ncbi:hypothetical protein [Reinekea sp. G2M2-21]|uniref:hypothetical protein n=1 Tax=Reinekea sp. G2M2-21 TaxID=2788942 RepID=UPI0018A93EAB|nr:hypothetical protein [Reinekea sp. G2M2-21]
MSDWRTTLHNYLKQSGPDIITTDEFRGLCYRFTALAREDGKPGAQRTADKFLKQMLIAGELQPLAGKGVFCNTLILGRKMSTREALGVINTFSSTDVSLFAGPRAVCGDNGPDGPHWILTSSNRTVVHKGLLGHDAEEPSLKPGKKPSEEELNALAEFHKGYALATSCNRNWLGLIRELPVESEAFTRFGSDGADGELSNVYVKTASPELALALLPSLASARHLYPTNESVTVRQIKGPVLTLDVYNPMSMRTAEAKVDVSNLARIMQSLPPMSDDVDFRKRGFDSITTKGSRPLSEILMGIGLSPTKSTGGDLASLSFDIPNIPDVPDEQLTPMELGFDIPETPTPTPRR